MTTSEEAPYTRAHVEPLEDYRVPSLYRRCRRAHCTAPPVADVRRSRYLLRRGYANTWWAYCANHLADYNREVREGVVWWKGVVRDA